MEVNAPVLRSMAKADMVLSTVLAVYTYLPDGSTATLNEPFPAEKGEPGTAVSAPVEELIENAATKSFAAAVPPSPT